MAMSCPTRWRAPAPLFSLVVFLLHAVAASGDSDADLVIKSRSEMYTNPVLPMDFPDPCVIRAQDGSFYAYATMGNGHHLQVATSKDLITWKYLGEALAAPPTWGKNDWWAPDVHYSHEDGVYYMYYATMNAQSGDMCVAIADSKVPQGPFRDSGAPVFCGTAYQAIDPKFRHYKDTGEMYLYFGSGQFPIDGIQLKDVRTPMPGAKPTQLLHTSSFPYESLVEGVWTWETPSVPGKTLMFYSGNNCCGPSAHYAVMVARSNNTHPFGPFEKLADAKGLDSSVVLAATSGALQQPGHNSVIRDDAGNDWMFYHAFNGTERTHRMLCADRIEYTPDGWPHIHAGGPSSTPQQGPVVNHRAE